ncbi:MAG: hypothetical protein ACTHMC_08405 [Pseudobacter sp.]|uniref:hypothetical protein n=1 Tax=Pseudobacter sp. TaxID=2045420 RepID=UPI003F7DB0E4
MKNIHYYINALLCIVLLNACEKNDTPGVASLNIFNGIAGSNMLVTNLNGTEPLIWYRSAHRLYYGDPGDVAAYNSVKNRFYSYSGLQRIAFFEYPDTLAHSVPVTRVQVDLPVSSINTLFLTGTIQAPDTLFLRDVLPYHTATDSTAGIRVVNLVNGLTVSVNLKNEASGSEVESLGYKAVSAFKNHNVKKDPEIYEFEIRDKTNGNLITTQMIDTRDRDIGYGISNLYRFRNFTIILFGELNNTGAAAPRTVVMSNN